MLGKINARNIVFVFPIIARKNLFRIPLISPFVVGYLKKN